MRILRKKERASDEQESLQIYLCWPKFATSNGRRRRQDLKIISTTLTALGSLALRRLAIIRVKDLFDNRLFKRRSLFVSQI